MTHEQLQQQKEFDIRFVEKVFPLRGMIGAQMNITISVGSRIEIMAIAGIDSGGREMFYNIHAPLMLEQASKKGKIECVSIIMEAEMRVPDIINGKPDLENYRSKPAKDVVMLTFLTPEKSELVVWYVQTDKTLRREIAAAESLDGMIPNVLSDFLEKRARKN